MITLEVVSATSIQVSWDRLDTPEITRYIVYYSQTGNSEVVTTVASSENSVTIENLLTDVEYQFQVVAVAELEGDAIMGERSNVSVSRPTPPPPTTMPLPSTTPTPASTETQCESNHLTIIHPWPAIAILYDIYIYIISCSCCSICLRNGYLHYCCGGCYLDPNTVYSSSSTCGVFCLPLS